MQIFNKNDKKMRKITKIFKFFKVDYSFFLIFVIAFLLDEIWLYVCFVLSILCHELTHYFVAKKLGYLPHKIHLTFFGASLEGADDFALSDEVKIVVAGPLFNLSVIIFCYLSFWFYPESYNFLNDLLLANWSILLFNFCPIYPLDMGRFLLAIFTKNKSRKDALEKTKRVSYIFISLFFVLFLLSFFYEYNFSLGFVCVNLTSLCFSSSRDTSYKRQLFAEKKFSKLKSGLIERTVYVENATPMFSLFKHIDDYHFVNFVFLDNKHHVVKKLSEIEFYEAMGLI